MKKLVAVLAFSLSASVSHAMGPEAVIGALIGGVIIGQATAPPAYYPPPPVYVQPGHPEVTFQGQYYYAPRPVRQCVSIPLYDAYGRFIQSTRRCHYVYQ